MGAYRILREIGQGGMAVVYLGERDDQNYRKQVAIKMVKPGIDTEQVLQRFRNERQTLAALDHSNIVKLLDGGSSEDGSPVSGDGVCGRPAHRPVLRPSQALHRRPPAPFSRSLFRGAVRA